MNSVLSKRQQKFNQELALATSHTLEQLVWENCTTNNSFNLINMLGNEIKKRSKDEPPANQREI